MLIVTKGRVNERVEPGECVGRGWELGAVIEIKHEGVHAFDRAPVASIVAGERCRRPEW
jgi:hypothetical protein